MSGENELYQAIPSRIKSPLECYEQYSRSNSKDLLKPY